MYGVFENKKQLLTDLNAVLPNISQSVGTTRDAAEALEESVKSYTQAKYCVSAKSGTQALTAALHAVGVRPDTYVITTPWTFIATCTAVTSLGAKVLFADVKSDNWTIDPVKIGELLDLFGPRVSCVIPVDLFGCPCDYTSILKICAAAGVPVVEDACQGFTGEYLGSKLTNVGCSIGVTSFYPTKPLGGYGEGGALVTNDGNLAAEAEKFLNHGSTRANPDCIGVGENGRIDSLNAALLVEKFKRIDELTAHRRAIDDVYRELLTGICRFQQVPKNCRSALYQDRVCITASDAELLGSVLTLDHLYDVNVTTNTRFSVDRARAKRAFVFSSTTTGLPINENIDPGELRQLLTKFIELRG